MAEAHVVRGNEGEVYDTTWIFKHGSLTGAPFDFLVGDVAYLTGPPLHVHHEQYDTFYVLEGVLAVQVGDEVLDLMPGDFASVPPGIPHTFDNIRKDQPPVKVCNLMTPGGLDEFLRTFNGLALATVDPAEISAAAERMKTELVGPPLGHRLGLAPENAN